MGGDTNSAIVTINVLGTEYHTDEDTAVTIETPTAVPDGDNVVEIDGTPIASGQTIQLANSKGTVTLNGDGTLTYDPTIDLETLNAGESVSVAFEAGTIGVTPGPFNGIAEDSFLTTATGDGGAAYDNDEGFGKSTNPSVTNGTTGFSAARVWGVSTNTSIIEATNVVSMGDGGSLTHNLLGEEEVGMVRTWTSHNRHSGRQIDAPIPSSSEYWISALVHSDKAAPTLRNSIGFGAGGLTENQPVNTTQDRVHIGFEGDDLVVFARDQVIPIVVDYAADTTYLVALRIEVDIVGVDSISAMYAADGDAALITAFVDSPVEVYQDTSDLSFLEIAVNARSGGLQEYHWFFDEPRLGTSARDLGITGFESTSTFTIEVDGLGFTASADIDVQGGAPLTSIVDGDATPDAADGTAFGGVDEVVGLSTQTFTIENTGTADLTVGAITISGVNASEFVVSSSPSALVAPAGTTTFTIDFDPSQTGLRAATVSIANNDATENPFNFSIQGTGVAPVFNGLAEDSFVTSPSGNGTDQYTDDVAFINGINDDVIGGTAGFTASQDWTGSNTGLIRTSSSAADAGGALNHSLVQGEEAGLVRMRSDFHRYVYRPINGGVPASGTYWMSALLNGDTLANSQRNSIGFGNGVGFANDQPVNLTEGRVHVGFQGDDIVVFAGADVFTVVADYTADTTYAVVVEIEADTTGDELISAYFAIDGDAELTPAFVNQATEAFQSTANLSFLEMAVEDHPAGSATYHFWVDEPRLATTFGDLNIIGLPNPRFETVSTVEVPAGITGIIHAVTAIDANAAAVAYSIVDAGSGGAADSGDFTIDSGTGELQFVAVPAFDAPADSDGNNVYQVTIRATAGSDTNDQLIAVTVSGLDYTASENSTVTIDSVNAFPNGDMVVQIDGVSPTLDVPQQLAGNNGSVTLNTNGTLTYDPTVDFNALDAGDSQSVSFDVTTFLATPGSFAGIAEDSFLTTATGDGGAAYDHDEGFGKSNNPGVTNGTTGFSASNVWGISTNSSIIEPSNSAADAGGALTHNLVTGEEDGLVRTWSSHHRHNARRLDAVPVSDEYWISALLNSDKSATNDRNSVGFGNGVLVQDQAVSASQARVHIGFAGNDIVAYLRDQEMTVVSDYNANSTYLVVAQITANDSGSDLVTVYYAEDGDAALTEAISAQTAEVFASTDDIAFMEIAVNAATGGVQAYHWYFDELRMATSLADLGVAGLSNTSTVSVTVAGANDAPEISQGVGPVAVTMSEDGSPTAFVAPTLGATDPESHALTWSLNSAASSGNAVVSGTGASPTITYAPIADFNGTDSFVVEVSDGSLSDTITVTVTVDPVNDAPVISQSNPVATTMSEDGAPTAFAVTIDATDVDNDTLTWTLAAGGDAANGTAVVSGTGASPTIVYTPTANFSGGDSFTVQVDDGNAATAAVRVEVTITQENDPAVFGGDLTGRETVGNGPVVGRLTAADPIDGMASPNFVVVGQGANGSAAIDSTTGAWFYTPVAGFDGDDTFTVQATDDDNNNETQVINVTIEPPVFLDSAGNLIANGTSFRDRIMLFRTGDGLAFRVNNVFYGSFRPTGEVIIRGDDGNDRISVAGNVRDDVTIYGGNGSDDIAAGPGNDTIFGEFGNDLILSGEGDNFVDGGFGNDNILGRSGRDILLGAFGNDQLSGGGSFDILIGGSGKDQISGGSGKDILIGGTSTHETDQTALDSILSLWSAVNNVEIGALTLRGTTPGFLAGSTVTLDDGSRDILQDRSGLDWFFVSDADGDFIRANGSDEIDR
ncbi:MAG: hypothetical protein ACI9HK_004143 [Pirellulaceae bacterium]